MNEESTSGICDEVRRIAANIAKLAACCRLRGGDGCRAWSNRL